MNTMKNLSLFGICFAFVVIALGAWTRLVDAGLGCPDWPGCYGFVVFPTTEEEIALAESRYPQFPYEIDKAIPEVVHRYFAAALGFLAILLVYFAFKNQLPKKTRKTKKKSPKKKVEKEDWNWRKDLGIDDSGNTNKAATEAFKDGLTNQQKVYQEKKHYSPAQS